MLFSQKPNFGYKRSPEEVNLQQWINGQIYIDLLKGGFLAFLTETKFWLQEVTCRGKSATKDQWPNLH